MAGRPHQDLALNQDRAMPRQSKPAPAEILGRVKSHATGLTPPQEAFAMAIALGGNLSDAYRGAFPRSIRYDEWPSPSSTNECTLMVFGSCRPDLAIVK